MLGFRFSLILEFKRASLSVFVVSSRGSVIAEFSVPLCSRGDAALAEELKSKLTPFMRGAFSIVLIPRSAVIMGSGIWPSQDEKELRRMISLNFSRHTPHGREEIILDFDVILPLAGGKSFVSCCMANKTILEGFGKVLRMVGIEPDLVTFDVIRHIAPLVFRLGGTDPQGRIYIYEEDGQVFLSLVFGEKLVFCREGAEGVSLEEDLRDFIATCLREFSCIALQEIVCAPEKTFVFDNVFAGLPVRDWSWESTGRNSYTQKALSELVQKGKVQFDLSLPEDRDRKKAIVRRRNCYHTATLLITGALIFCLPFMARTFQKFSHVDKFRRDTILMEKRVAVAQKDRDRLNAFRRYAGSRQDIVAVQALLSRGLSGKVLMEDIEYVRGSGWKFTGTADSVQDVQAIPSILLGALSACRVDSVDKRVQETGASARFVISCQEKADGRR